MDAMETALTTSTVEAPVYQSIGHEEFGRLLRKFGYAIAPPLDEGRQGYRTLAEPRFTALLRAPLQQRAGEFGEIFIYAYTDLSIAVSAAVIQALRRRMTYAHLDMNVRGRLAATHFIALTGGVTESHLRTQLWYWKTDLDRVIEEVKRQVAAHSGSWLH
jgi:hypothetical protein